MPRTCTVCRHDARAEVDRALLQGEPYRRRAKRWSLGEAAVQRRKAHIGAPVLAEWSASQAEIYAGLADYTAELERDARRIAEEAAAATLGAVDDLADEGYLNPRMAAHTGARLAERINGPRRGRRRADPASGSIRGARS